MTVPPGLQIPLTASPGQHVPASVRPFLAGDLSADPQHAVLPAAKDMGARAYIGVPIVLADGTFFGALVGLDSRPKSIPTSRSSGSGFSLGWPPWRSNGRASRS